MRYKVDRRLEGERTVFEVSGRIGAETVQELRSAIDGVQGSTMDLRHVSLVDVEGVRFLLECEGQGMELRNCSPFVREWMSREQAG